VRLRLLSLAASLLVLLTGCGGGDSSDNGVASKSPTEIVAEAKAAADSASSVHVSGTIMSGGTPLTLDMDLVAGKGGRGRLAENGLGFELIQIGETVYINGSAAFDRHYGGATGAQLLQGKWLKAPASSGSFATLSSLTDLHKLLDTALASHGPLAKSGTTTVEGQKVVGVTEAAQGGTLYVATTGKPYPIEISKAGAGGGKIVFDRWNEPVVLTAPSSVIDLSQLQSGH
jgi:hypothetical protein